MHEFTPGLKLSRLFFRDAVRPILDHVAPDLKYAAGLIGSGSEVLGFDDEMSSDHHWGPRVMIFLNDVEERERLVAVLRDELPTQFLGYSTNFSEPDPNDNNVQRLVASDDGSVNHRVEFFTPREYLLAYLNFDIENDIEPVDWLTFPEQKLRSITGDTIFHDEIGLKNVLARFAYYPHDVWLYLLASGWKRIGQEEHLMGRAGLAGDDIGSALIASRLVRDIIRLCFLMECAYAPYPKWFGTAFRQMKCESKLTPHLEAVLRSTTWQERESHLVPAYEVIANMHNELGITVTLPSTADNFFGRPFKVIELMGGFVNAIRSQIQDGELKQLPLIGSIDQFTDSTDVLADATKRMKIRKLYQ